MSLRREFSKRFRTALLLLFFSGLMGAPGASLLAGGGQAAASGQIAASAGQEKNPQADPDLSKRTTGIRVLSNLVVTPVTVLDGSGQFVYDLQESDFQIYDNGLEQKLTSFEVELRALSVLIVVETDKEMGTLLDQVHPLGPVFSALLLGEQGQAAVLDYDERVRVLQDFSNNSELLDKTLKHVAISGNGRRLNDALWRALTMLESRPKSERRVIIALSDGFDAGSETHRDAVIRRATTDGIGIYGLGFRASKELLARQPEPHHVDTQDQNVTRPTPPGKAPTATIADDIYSRPIPGVPILTDLGHMIRSKFASSSLELYAGYTGGVYYSHGKETELQNQLQQISSEIHSQYELAYVPDDLDQMGFHRITVKVRPRGLKVRTRAGYFYGGAAH